MNIKYLYISFLVVGGSACGNPHRPAAVPETLPPVSAAPATAPEALPAAPAPLPAVGLMEGMNVSVVMEE